MGTSSDRPLIVSFATNDRYGEHGERLIARCEELGLDHHVEFFEPWADKRETCIHRPDYMLRLLREYRRPLVWFDADGEILRPFEVPNGPAGFVRNPWDHPHNHITAGIFMMRDEMPLRIWKDYCDQWQRGEIGSHRRLCWTADRIKWADMTPYVEGKVIVRTQNDERRL